MCWHSSTDSWWTLQNQVFESSRNHQWTIFQPLWNLPQLRGRYWVSQPAAGPGELRGSHLWIAVYRISRWLALVNTVHSGHNLCWVILTDGSGRRQPKCGQGVPGHPSSRPTALATKIRAQWEFFPKQAQLTLVCHSGSRWPGCGQRVPDAQITVLVSKIPTEWGLSWCVSVAQVAAPSHLSIIILPYQS